MSETAESSVFSVNPLMWIESIRVRVVVDNSSGLHPFYSLLLRGREENVKMASNMTEILSKYDRHFVEMWSKYDRNFVKSIS